MTEDSSNSEEVARLKQAIDADDVEQVKALMTGNPQLHRAPLGRNGAGPLTWVAECRVPWRPPTPERLEIARWMIENGSDIHQGGGQPLARAALADDRIPMMELLVAHGADVNAVDDGGFRILLLPARRSLRRPLAGCSIMELSPISGRPSNRSRGPRSTMSSEPTFVRRRISAPASSGCCRSAPSRAMTRRVFSISSAAAWINWAPYSMPILRCCTVTSTASTSAPPADED